MTSKQKKWIFMLSVLGVIAIFFFSNSPLTNIK